MTPQAWTDIDPGEVDVRLVITDMDGTLLDGDGSVPEGFWPLLERIRESGATFVPASGRQYQTLFDEFSEQGGVTSFIAENGTMVVLDGEIVSTTTLDRERADDAVRAVRGAMPERNLGAVLCGVQSAYIERTDDAFLAEARKYYHRFETVKDLTAVEDDVLKVAVYDFDDAEATAPEVFAGFEDDLQVVISGQHWIDLMPKDAGKGLGVRALQQAAGASPAQTVVFGDYLNDLQMYEHSELSFAMENAHEDIKDAAAYLAPSNTEHGVVQVLERLLGERD